MNKETREYIKTLQDAVITLQEAVKTIFKVLDKLQSETKK